MDRRLREMVISWKVIENLLGNSLLCWILVRGRIIELQLVYGESSDWLKSIGELGDGLSLSMAGILRYSSLEIPIA